MVSYYKYFKVYNVIGLIDPTTKITESFYAGHFEETKLECCLYEVGDVVPATCNDHRAIVQAAKQGEKYSSKYFRETPKYLKEIRQNVINEIYNTLY